MDFDSLVDDSQKQAAPQAEAPADNKPLMFDELKPDQTSQLAAPKFDDLQDDQEKYGTPTQKAMTGLEGLARGATLGASDALMVGMRKAASALGVSDENLHYIAPEPENVYGRQQSNPNISSVGEMAGNVATTMALPEIKIAKLGAIGSKALTGMVQMGLIGAGDEFSKNMLGHGDPASAAAYHVAANAGLGLLGSAILAPVEKSGLKVLENAKIGKQMKSFVAGIGHALSLPEEGVIDLANSALTKSEREALSPQAFKYGQQVLKNAGSVAVGTAAGLATHSMTGGFGAGYAERQLEKLLAPITSKYSQKIAPAVLGAAQHGSINNWAQVLDHVTTAQKGYSKIMKGIEGLFEASGNKVVDEMNNQKQDEKLKEYIEQDEMNNQIQQAAQGQPSNAQGYAKGGEVNPEVQEPNSVATAFPEQNVLISATKARLAGYLKSQRPLKPLNGLPYDSDRKDPHQEREYNQVINLANNPLSILNKIKSGELLPKQVASFNAMYPELHQELSKKLTEKIMKNKLDKSKKPSYKVRQAMSLFLGSNLDSSLSQPNMMAAQMVFAKQKAQNQPNKSSPALSKMDDSSRTNEQARAARQTKV